MATVELTKENFEQVVNDNDMVVIDFWAPWCAPCRNFAPTFEAESGLHDDVVFGKVNTEEQQELAAAFNIRSIPTLMFFRERVILYAEEGFSKEKWPVERSSAARPTGRRSGAPAAWPESTLERPLPL